MDVKVSKYSTLRLLSLLLDTSQNTQDMLTLYCNSRGDTTKRLLSAILPDAGALRQAGVRLKVELADSAAQKSLGAKGIKSLPALCRLGASAAARPQQLATGNRAILRELEALVNAAAAPMRGRRRGGEDAAPTHCDNADLSNFWGQTIGGGDNDREDEGVGGEGFAANDMSRRMADLQSRRRAAEDPAPSRAGSGGRARPPPADEEQPLDMAAVHRRRPGPATQPAPRRQDPENFFGDNIGGAGGMDQGRGGGNHRAVAPRAPESNDPDDIAERRYLEQAGAPDF